jgi:hypothetical protein
MVCDLALFMLRDGSAPLVLPQTPYQIAERFRWNGGGAFFHNLSLDPAVDP